MQAMRTYNKYAAIHTHLIRREAPTVRTTAPSSKDVGWPPHRPHTPFHKLKAMRLLIERSLVYWSVDSEVNIRSHAHSSRPNPMVKSSCCWQGVMDHQAEQSCVTEIHMPDAAGRVEYIGST